MTIKSLKLELENKERMQYMENIGVSVIIPVYNGEIYVRKSFEQAKKQTLKNVEYIYIDDGSIDKSGSILETLLENQNNFYVYHQKNIGVSAARNLGITKAKGKYIMFWDVDDEYDVDLCETLYYAAEKNDSSIVVSGCNIDDDVIDNSENALKRLLSGEISVSAADKIYLKNIVQNVLFDKDIKIYEDLLFNYNTFKYAMNISYIKNVKYHYVRHNESSSRTSFHKKYLQGKIVVDYIYEDVRNNNKSLLRYAEQKKIWMYLRLTKLYYLRNGGSDLKKDIYMMRKYLKTVPTNVAMKSLKKFDKMRYLTYIYCFPVYLLCLKTFDKR